MAPTPPENKRSVDQKTPTLARSQELPPSPEAGQPRASSASGASRLSVRMLAEVIHVAPGGGLGFASGLAGLADWGTCELHSMGEHEKDPRPVMNKCTEARTCLVGRWSRVWLRPRAPAAATVYSAGECAVSRRKTRRRLEAIGGLLLQAASREVKGPGTQFKGRWSKMPLVTVK